MDYNKAINFLENGNPKGCIDFFKDNNYILEYTYSLLLLEKINEAENILKKTDSVRADWLNKIILIIKGKCDIYPTYFQIRNFLEIDLNLFFKSNKINYVNKIMAVANIFQQINNESYKFFGRVLLKNNYPKESKIFLDKSLDSYYNDVELHYLFVEYYLYMNDFENAKRAVNNCLKINPKYYPAIKTKNNLYT